VQPAQKDVGRNRPGIEHRQEMVSPSLDEWQVENFPQRLVLDGAVLTLRVLTVLALDQFLECELPGPLGDGRVGCV
jgi:hypothetical protein